MIHTAEMHFALVRKNIEMINNTRTIYHLMSEADFPQGNIGGITFTIVSRRIDINAYNEDVELSQFYENREWMIYLKVDFIKLLNGETQITEHHIPVITRKLNDFFCPILGQIPGNLILNRVDYRFDAIVENSDIRKILIKLYKKTA